MGDKTRGLYNKFRVERTDGSDAPGGRHDSCEYFVLDLTHDPHALPALRAYADSCAKDYPMLAADLRAKLSPAPEPKACGEVTLTKEQVDSYIQAAIDAALEHVAGLFDYVGKHDEAGFLRSWCGTNPLAEKQAAIDAALESVAEWLDTHQTTMDQSVYDWAVEFIRSRLNSNPLAEAQARIAELERELAEARKNAGVNELLRNYAVDVFKDYTADEVASFPPPIRYIWKQGMAIDAARANEGKE